jgi:hypothetical protein
MKKKYLIELNELCNQHNIETSFISSLRENSMLDISTIKEIDYINIAQLQKLEKFSRLFYDLNINIEGIEAITHLLERLISIQDEVNSLRNSLSLYETLD